ncbi:MAG: 3-methyl-2-oxobutanoate hydroxymethyltransferase, partial [Verrucomicrobiota bacterium]
SYDTPEETLQNSLRLIEAGADAVTLEGGLGQLEKVRLLTESGISVCAHLGMLPQRVVEEGGYRKKGKDSAEAERLLEAAVALESEGVFAVVLESMVPSVAAAITASLKIPTIGIGAGEECDGQIRVLHDVMGGYPWFVPPFAKVYGNVAEVIRNSVEEYIKDVES